MNHERVTTLLHQAGRWQALADVARCAAWCTVWLLAAVLAALVLDAWGRFGAGGLIVLDVGLALTAGGLLAWLVFVLARGRPSASRVARLLETKLDVANNVLINALHLSISPPRSASTELIDAAVARGCETASKLRPQSVVEPRPVVRAAAGAIIAVIIMAVVALAMPRLFSLVGPRLLAPYAGHRPFTLLNFKVQVEPANVYVGKPATIVVAIDGPSRPQQADLVFADHRNPAGQHRHLPMSIESADDGRFILSIERAERSRRFFIYTAAGRSRMYDLSVLPTPLFESVSVSYDYPSYTGWPPPISPLDAHAIRAIVGTHVTITATSNVPLRNGLIELFDSDNSSNEPQQVTMQCAEHDPGTVIGRFVLQDSGTYRLSLIGADDAPGASFHRGTLEAQPDERPDVAIVTPPPALIAPQGWQVPVEVSATDDVAVARLTLTQTVNDRPADTSELAAGSPAPQTRAAHAIDLAKLQAVSGDTVTYFATAYDNYPPAGQAADSPIHVIGVISKVEYEKLMRAQYGIEQIWLEHEQWRRQLDELRQRRRQLLEQLEQLELELESNIKDPESAGAADRRQMEQVEQQLQQYAADAATLADELHQRADQPPLYEFEPAYADELRHMAGELDGQSGAAAGLQAALENLRSVPTATSKNAAARALERFRDEPDDAGETEASQAQLQHDLQAVMLADRLMSLATQLSSIARRQRDLANYLKPFEASLRLSLADQLRAARLAEQQNALRDELDRAVEQLRTTAAEAEPLLPRMSAGAMQVADAIEQMAVVDDQSKAADAAAAGDGPAAYQSADEAASDLESLLSQCRAVGQSATNELDGCFSLPNPKLQQLIDQMAQGRAAPRFTAGSRSGVGMAGARAPIQIAGPHADAVARHAQPSNRLAGGKALPIDGPPLDLAEPAELFDAGIQSVVPAAARHMPGVPPAYRDLAAAYLRRIAADNVTGANENDTHDE